MLTKMTNSERLNAGFRWCLMIARGLVGSLFGRRQNFLQLTPGFLSRQKILDLRRRTIISFGIRNITDSHVVSQIFVNEDYYLGRFSRGADIVRRYERLLELGKTPLIFDCGANCGLASRYFSHVFPAARIVAIEPDPDNIKTARLNNAGAQVDFVLAGIGSTDSRGDIVDPGAGTWAYRLATSETGSTEIFSFDTLLRRYHHDRFVPLIAKIDIEGFEADLFKSATEWVDRFPLIIIELHDWMLPRQANSREFLRCISQRDRDFVFFGENVFSISNEPLTGAGKA